MTAQTLPIQNTPPPSAAPIAIVGAGLIGSTIAFTLRRAGYPITVFDANLPGAAWKAGAGMLTPEGEGLQGTPLEEIARESLRLWPHFARELEEYSGQSVHFREGLERMQADGSRQMTPGEGQIHPPSVVGAALHGLEMRGEKVLRLEPTAQGVTVQTAQRDFSASLVILAAGVWSAAFGLPVFPVQGQALLLDASHEQPALFGRRRGGKGAKGYTLCRPDGVYVGATVRRTFATETDTHARRWLEGQTRRLLPHLAHARVKRTLVGLRPCTADDLPIVGPHPTLPNVLVATGHGRHGALLAPWTAQKVLELVRERRPIPLEVGA